MPIALNTILADLHPIDLYTPDDGCELHEPNDIFTAVFDATKGRPCLDCTCQPCKITDEFVEPDKTLRITIPPHAIEPTDEDLSSNVNITGHDIPDV